MAGLNYKIWGRRNQFRHRLGTLADLHCVCDNAPSHPGGNIPGNHQILTTCCTNIVHREGETSAKLSIHRVSCMLWLRPRRFLNVAGVRRGFVEWLGAQGVVLLGQT